MRTPNRRGMVLFLAGMLLAAALPLRAQDKEEEMKKLLGELIREAGREMEAMEKLASTTVEIDKQLAAMQELKMLKEDLAKLRKTRDVVFSEYEAAVAGLKDAQMEIVAAAEKVQLARTNTDVEKAVKLAYDKVNELKRQLEIMAREGKELKKLKAAMDRDVAGMFAELAALQKKFAREIASSPEVARQLEALQVEIMELDVKLKRTESLSEAKEIVRAIGYTYEKLEILKTTLGELKAGKDKKSLALMERKLKKIEQAAQKAADTGEVDDFFLTAPLESIKLIYSRDRISDLYLNSLNHYFTGNLGRMNLVYVLILGLLICVLGFSVTRMIGRK